MTKKTLLLSLLVLLMCSCTDSLKFIELTTEMQTNPEGVYTLNPRFSWKFTDTKTDVMQTAYLIEVAATEQALKAGESLLWSSGRVETDRSQLIEYSGTIAVRLSS